MVMRPRGPVSGSFGMSSRRRAAEEEEAAREAARTPEQHDRIAAGARDRARMYPGTAEIHLREAAHHEAEAARKRSLQAKRQSEHLAQRDQDAALTPEQHERFAAANRRDAELMPSVKKMYLRSAERHEAEATRKRAAQGSTEGSVARRETSGSPSTYIPRAEREYSYTIGDQSMGPSATSRSARPDVGWLQEQRKKEYADRNAAAERATEEYRSLRARIGQDPSATHEAANALADRAATAHLNAREAARGLSSRDMARHNQLMEEHSDYGRGHTIAAGRERAARQTQSGGMTGDRRFFGSQMGSGTERHDPAASSVAHGARLLDEIDRDRAAEGGLSARVVRVVASRPEMDPTIPEERKREAPRHRATRLAEEASKGAIGGGSSHEAAQAAHERAAEIHGRRGSAARTEQQKYHLQKAAEHARLASEARGAAASQSHASSGKHITFEQKAPTTPHERAMHRAMQAHAARHPAAPQQPAQTGPVMTGARGGKYTMSGGKKHYLGKDGK